MTQSAPQPLFARFRSLSLATLPLVALASGCGSESEAKEGEGGFLRLEDEPAATAQADGAQAAQAEPAGSPKPVAESPAPAVVTPEPEKPAEAAAPLASRRGDEGASPAEAALSESELELRATEALDRGAPAEAARLLSRLMLAHVDAGRDDRVALARWTALLQQAQSQHRWNPKGAWPAVDVKVQSGDTLIGIRKRCLDAQPGLLLCTGQIVRANRLASSSAIRPDEALRVPTERASMRVDLSAMWAFYCFGDEVAAAWEVGVGREGSDTRPGVFTIGAKQERPMWSPVGREPVPFGDPANPLGTRWLAWYQEGRATSLGFHGTNDPTGVGKRVSEGCIRMRNEDVEQLFEILPLNAEVRVQP
ncbi:MAG: L,D-transpeptidase [Planctomycetota bacterium]|nr:L,D-transpeptidase [Planctomycetota bacterium]